MKKRIINIGLLLIIFLSTNFSMVQASDETDTLKKNIKKESDNIEKLQEQIDEANKTIKDSEKEIKNLNEQIQKMNDEINRSTIKLNNLVKDSSVMLEYMQQVNSQNKLLLLLNQKDNSLSKIQGYQVINETLMQKVRKIDTEVESQKSLQANLESSKFESQKELENITEKKSELEKEEKEQEKQITDLKEKLVELEKEEAIKLGFYDESATISQAEQEKLMKAVGIKENDYQYVDYIVTRESSWNYTAVNPYSEAYGLCQALPGEKLATAGDDWQTNPETQLKWCNGYAKDRYGNWENAYDFHKENSWW